MKVTVYWKDPPTPTKVEITCQKNPDERTQKLIQYVTQKETITIQHQGEIRKLSVGDIFYIDAVEDKTFIYTKDEALESGKRLYKWEEELINNPFVRVSKGVVVNTDKVKSVKSLVNGKLEAILKNGEKVLVNRHYVLSFKKAFGLF